MIRRKKLFERSALTLLLVATGCVRASEDTKRGTLEVYPTIAQKISDEQRRMYDNIKVRALMNPVELLEANKADHETMCVLYEKMIKDEGSAKELTCKLVTLQAKNPVSMLRECTGDECSVTRSKYPLAREMLEMSVGGALNQISGDRYVSFARQERELHQAYCRRGHTSEFDHRMMQILGPRYASRRARIADIYEKMIHYMRPATHDREQVSAHIRQMLGATNYVDVGAGGMFNTWRTVVHALERVESDRNQQGKKCGDKDETGMHFCNIHMIDPSWQPYIEAQAALFGLRNDWSRTAMNEQQKLNFCIIREQSSQLIDSLSIMYPWAKIRLFLHRNTAQYIRFSTKNPEHVADVIAACDVSFEPNKGGTAWNDLVMHVMTQQNKNVRGYALKKIMPLTVIEPSGLSSEHRSVLCSLMFKSIKLSSMKVHLELGPRMQYILTDSASVEAFNVFQKNLRADLARSYGTMLSTIEKKSDAQRKQGDDE